MASAKQRKPGTVKGKPGSGMPAPAAGAKPKFGSPAWNAKYGVSKLGKGKKGK